MSTLYALCLAFIVAYLSLVGLLVLLFHLWLRALDADDNIREDLGDGY